MTSTVDDDNKVQGIVLLTDEASKILNPREEIAYKEHRRELAEWMLNLGIKARLLNVSLHAGKGSWGERKSR